MNSDNRDRGPRKRDPFAGLTGKKPTMSWDEFLEFLDLTGDKAAFLKEMRPGDNPWDALERVFAKENARHQKRARRRKEGCTR